MQDEERNTDWRADIGQLQPDHSLTLVELRQAHRRWAYVDAKTLIACSLIVSLLSSFCSPENLRRTGFFHLSRSPAR